MRFKTHLIILLALCLPFALQSQVIYNGHVQDVGNRATLSKAKIELLHSPDVQYTNTFGDFLIKNTAQDSIPPAKYSYSFFNNALIWDGSFELNLELFAIDGRRIVHQSNLFGGSFILPRIPAGVYVIRVQAKEEMQSFKAFSNGYSISVADKSARWHRSVAPLQPDTLVVSKFGYFTRHIPLTGRDTQLNISLLKRELSELHYFNELIDPLAYEIISSEPSRTNNAEVEAVKIIYNEENKLMYYINTKRYQSHFKFSESQLDFKQGHAIFNATQYRENKDRFLYPANLNYYKSLDKYILQFVSANEIDCEKIKIIFEKILETSYLKDKLFLFANRPEFNDCDFPIITPEELYSGQNYQALNLAENYGYLQKVELEDVEEIYLGRHDIALLNGIPNDVAVVAGIITTEFQTPLSHINVLSHNRNTPNMALRNGWESEQLDSLLGQLIYLKVKSDSFEIRTATLDEATKFWNQHEPQNFTVLPKNVEVKGLIDLPTADYTYLDIIGGKATNFAEMLNVSIDGQPIPTPESSFAIPFYYYDQHLKSSELGDYIDKMLQDEAFLNSPATRKDRLKDLRKKIKDHPLDPALIELVKNKIKNFQDFSSFRFRSSTNAEDLESFSGAGLYSSYSAKQNEPSKTIERAIKKVWASLWNWRAFEERSYYKIVHTSCAMGILVHRSFPDEDANGVLITKNLYNDNPGFIINVQFKEHSIVFPEPGVLHDQIMLFTWSVVPGENFMVEYLTFSNLPELNGQPVMTNAELVELGEYCKALKEYFYQEVPHDCNCSEKNFGLDIEFKVDSQVSDRKIYIKQARFYK